MKRRVGLLLCWCFLAATPNRAADDVVKGLYDNAILLLRQGRPDEALKDLERIYKSYPNSEYADEALYRLGVYHLENKQYQAALDRFQDLISTFGDRNMAPEAYFSMGTIYETPDFPGFDYEKADANFARVYNIYSRSSKVDAALLHSGIIRAKLRELDNARTNLQRLVDEYPQSSLAPQALYQLGLLLAQLNEPIQALQHLQQVIDDYDDPEQATLAKRAINNLYRIHIGLAGAQTTAPYSADSEFSTKKFKKVSAIAVDHQDSFYVATQEGTSVRTFGTDGSEQQPIANQKSVQDLFVDISGDLFIVRSGAVVYRGQDHVLRKKTPKGLVPLTDMIGLLCDAGRSLFVRSESASNLLQFDKDENYIADFPSFKVNDLQDMAMDPLGNAYLIDGKLEKLLKLDSGGSPQATLEKKGDGYTFKEMSQVTVDRMGTVYVLDGKEKKLYLFSPDLKLLYAFSPPGLNKPRLLAVDSAGTLYIYDEKEDVIRKYL